mgnify:CR=1 FL=1
MSNLVGKIGSGGGLLGAASSGGSLSGKLGQSSGGTSDHRFLLHRDADDQHPMSAVTGLADALKLIPAPVEPITNSEMEELLK